VTLPGGLRRLLVVALVVLAGSPVVTGHAASAPRPVRNDATAVRTLEAATSTGRSGAYYIPPGAPGRALPLLVMLHGTGGKGSLVVTRLRALADRQGFIALAPDSVSVAGVWLTQADAPGPGEDQRHVVASVREVLAVPEARVDRARVLLAGFSVGGGMAAYLASREDVFTAFAVLHGHVPVDALGPRRVRGWLSTGDRDGRRTAEQVRATAEQVRRAGFADVTMRVFRGDHALSDEELAALVGWWLDPRRG